MRTTTWENIGTDTIGVTGINEALDKAGLNFNVSKQPIYSKFGASEIQVPNRVVTMRDDTGDILGIVGDDYSVCQNEDAFAFVDYISDDLSIEKAGMTQSGLMYVIAKFPDVNILGDSFTPHLIFQNSFNGGYPVKAAICPLRIVCQNQLALSFRNTPNSITIRHSASMADRLDAARKTFLETAEYMRELNTQAEYLATKPFTITEFNKFIDTQFEIKPDMTPLQKQRIQESRDAIIRAYNTNDNGNFRGTAWGAVNAMSDYLTHRQPNRKSNKFDENKFIAVTFNPVLLQQLYAHVA